MKAIAVIIFVILVAILLWFGFSRIGYCETICSDCKRRIEARWGKKCPWCGHLIGG